MKQKITKEQFRQIIREEHDNLIEEGIVSWMVDKVANGLKNYANKKAEYQYNALLNSKDFKSLASKYGYKDEKAWTKKSKELISKDPKKFADILAYDVKKGPFSKYFQ